MPVINNRVAVIDHMKAIGILAIMIGHALGLSTNFETLLYGFHVPLFFFISGVLLSDQKLGLPVYQFFVK
ncbi:MAG: acyltransferase family protein, partial [Methylophilus sp.]